MSSHSKRRTDTRNNSAAVSPLVDTIVSSRSCPGRRKTCEIIRLSAGGAGLLGACSCYADTLLGDIASQRHGKLMLMLNVTPSGIGARSSLTIAHS